MRNKLFILFGGYLLVFLTGLVSCTDDCGPFPNKYKITGLDWFIYEATYSTSTEPKLVLSDIEGDTVDFDNYAIFIRPQQETYFAQDLHERTFSLMNSAYACSPVEPNTDEKIDSIVIESAKDFDTSHPSGTDLSDLFDVVVFDPTNNMRYDKYRLKDYLGTKPFVPSELSLILREPPALTTDFEFLVKYYQNGIDHDYFEFSTNKIVIKKE